MNYIYLCMYAHTTVRLYNDQRSKEINENYESCFLPCSVQATSNKNLINPPYVRWEHRYTLGGIYIPLVNATFWQKFELFFTNYPNYCKLREGSTTGVYDCDLEIRPCPQRYGGEYQCTVYDFDGGSNVTRKVTLDVQTNSDFGGCVIPHATLNPPELVSRNNSLSINFSWTPINNENVCQNHAFSVRSHESSVPYDFEDTMAPPPTQDRYEPLNQQTYYVFDNINRFTYYIFELRIQALSEFSKQYSYVHYFGDQVPARVTNPASSHSVIRANEGDSVTIPCEGTGIPTPSVLLLKEVTNEPQACSGCPPVSKNNFFESVSANDAGEYFCVASNTLVSGGQYLSHLYKYMAFN